MKKRYKKPVIVFEDFTLSATIAGDCEIKTHTPAVMQCAYEVVDEFFGTMNIFISGVSSCVFTQPDGYDGICYHVFTDNSLFNS